MELLTWTDKLNASNVVLALALIIIAAIAWLMSTKKTYPPGPRPLPVVGNAIGLLRSKDLMSFFTNLAEKYGPVSLIWIGSQPLVLLNSWEAAKEAYISKAEQFHQRPFLWLQSKAHNGKPTGVIFTNGETHKAMRRLTLMTLHDFGLGKQSLEEKIEQEAKILLDQLGTWNGQPIDAIKKLIQLTVSNVIVSICFGSRLSYDDSDFADIITALDTSLATNLFFAPQNFFTLSRILPSGGPARALKSVNLIKAYIGKQIDCHKETYDGVNMRDFIDLYLKAESESDQYFTADNLHRVIIDLFIAGSETTATTLAWALLYLAKYPLIQERAQRDIDSLLGRDKTPSGKERERLVYVEAILHEVLRVASVVPLGLPRYVTHKGVSVCGYELPRGSLVMPTVFNIHMNKDYWQDPQVFRPERWISPNNVLLKLEHYMPFSIGKRNCLGETFGKIEAFMILTMLLQRFKFSFPEGYPVPSTEDSVTGTTRAPPPYKIRAVSRT